MTHNKTSQSRSSAIQESRASKTTNRNVVNDFSPEAHRELNQGLNT